MIKYKKAEGMFFARANDFVVLFVIKGSLLECRK